MNYVNKTARFFLGERWITQATPYSNMCKIFTPSHEWEKWLYDTYGTIYWRMDGYTWVLSVAESDKVVEVLMTNASDVFTRRRIIACGNPLIDNVLSLLRTPDHKRIRTVLAVGFRNEYMKVNMTFSDAHEASEMLIQAEGTPNLEEVVGSFIVKSTFKKLFGYEVKPEDMPEFLNHIKAFLAAGATWREFINIYIPQTIRKLFPSRSVFKTSSIDFFKDFAIRARAERMELLSNLEDDAEKPKDLLQSLLDAREEGIVDDNEIIAQFLMIFIAGYDTNSSVIRCALTHLALYPEMQERLYQEVRGVREEFAVIRNLIYLDAVVNESFRICPGAVTFERTAEKDHVFAQRPHIKVKAGQVVSIPVYCMNHDPRKYPNPDQFIPDRFFTETGGRVVKRSVPGFHPFGKGKRSCVGEPLAWVLIKCFLVVTVKKFQFHLPPGVQPPFGYEEKQGQLKFKNIPVVFERRAE